MNIFKPQIPYRFHPPRYSPVLAPLLYAISDVFFLRRKFKVASVAVEGAERVAALVRGGHTVLTAPNHADHADPFVLAHIGRRWSLPFHFMAAREGFEESRINAFAMQRSGVFSVDREGTDVAAVKTAIKILQKGQYPLVIFPEGEIYHHHERLAPLNDGVATILLRAAGGLHGSQRAFLVPTAIRYFYDDAAASTFSPRLDRLEASITWKPRPDLDIVERIYRLGSGLIGIKEVEYFGHGQPGTLIERILNLQSRLVERIEARHDGRPEGKSIPERVKALRGKIRRRLFENDPPISSTEREALLDDLDTLYLAVQLYSYPGQYLRERPTVHRIAETILKLEEDVLGSAEYSTSRRTAVRFGVPIDVGEFLRERSLTAKTAAEPLIDLTAERIQLLMNAIETGEDR